MSDTLTLAEPPLQLPGQAFGLATEESPDFDAASCDGILVRPQAALRSSLLPHNSCREKEHTCAPDAQQRLPLELQLNPRHGALQRQGLALPGLSKASGGRPGFWHMLDLGILDSRMFSLWLNPDVSELAAGGDPLRRRRPVAARRRPGRAAGRQRQVRGTYMPKPYMSKSYMPLACKP